jgi:hypothetical protein
LRVFIVCETMHDKEAIKKSVEEMCSVLRFEVTVKVIEIEGETIEFYTHDWTVRAKSAVEMKKIL